MRGRRGRGHRAALFASPRAAVQFLMHAASIDSAHLGSEISRTYIDDELGGGLPSGPRR
jgi:hypothetical protein